MNETFRHKTLFTKTSDSCLQSDVASSSVTKKKRLRQKQRKRGKQKTEIFLFYLNFKEIRKNREIGIMTRMFPLIIIKLGRSELFNKLE